MHVTLLRDTHTYVGQVNEFFNIVVSCNSTKTTYFELMNRNRKDIQMEF